jgi:hypothetical protein
VTAFLNDPRHLLERTRVVADLNFAYLELLSARAATDKLCVNNSVQSIVRNCDKEKILNAISAASALYEFYSKLGAHLHQ